MVSVPPGGEALLAVDVGNTNTVLGLYEGASSSRHWRLTTRRDATADEIALSVRGLLAAGPAPGGARRPTRVIVASVVPSLRFPLRQAFRQIFGREPVFVEPGIKTGMPILYEVPQEVGADRIVNAVAALDARGRAVHRRGLRHGDDLRRRDREGRVRRRRDRARASRSRPRRSSRRPRGSGASRSAARTRSSARRRRARSSRGSTSATSRSWTA